MGLRGVLKSACNGLAMVLVVPCGLTCWLESVLTGQRGESLFGLWGQLFALFPGVPGLFLRRAFYRWTLDECSPHCHIGFGVLFTRRRASIAEGAYVGPYALIGNVRIGEGSLIGSRASLLSGGQQHQLQEDGTWSATDPEAMPTIEIGANVWVGEGAIVMAELGSGAMVSAGGVVSSAVPEGVMVAGNPARFVKRLGVRGDASEDGPRPSTRREVRAAGS